ncbi:hypothetical protein LWI29_021342 [Acer saccharum]|uniref:Bulb-type lectin domain-containing protein n=1 Tax=Acer saccharum TaxID=4024 RepID=A0AA39RJW7_ACESA|nr:hypothetical protein LWI29_021342 [Acer saccharum]
MVMGISALLHLSLLLLLVLLLPIVALTANINFETPILASEDSSPWRSPSGEFAFGFRKLDGNPDHFLLAIWFENVPNKTIVWSANGNDPARRGSEVKLTNNGALVLKDPQGKELWKTPEDNNSKSSSAAMRDDGNFVLLDGNSKSIWESFKEPTDTILPGQILDMPSDLTSRRTPDNYSDGRFQLRLQRDGNLVLYPISESTESLYGAYWASGTVNTKSQLVFDKAGYIYMKEAEGTKRIFDLTNVDMSPMQNFYHLARIDYDGVFRQYSYSKEEKCNLSWKTVRKYPEDICLAITGDVGSGACGYNSYCRQRNGEKKCLCPENYSYVDSRDEERGCKPNFPLPTCQENGWEANPKLVEFKRLNNTDWPFSDYDLQTGNAVTEQMCEQLCREDCFCAAAIYNDNHYCWKKKYPLSNGRKSTSVNRIALLKVPKDGAFRLFEEKKDQSTLILIVSLLLGSSVFLNIFLILAIFLAVYFSYHKWLLQSFSSVSGGNIRRVQEDTTLYSVIEKHLKHGPCNHQLRPFCEEQLDCLKFFIRKYPKGPKSPFRELDLKSPIRQQLSNVVLLEYPIIYVFLPSHSYDFEVVKDCQPVTRRPMHSDPVSNVYESHKGIAFREEEIEEDVSTSDTRVLDLMKPVKSSQGPRNSNKDRMSEKVSNNTDSPSFTRTVAGNGSHSSPKADEPGVSEDMFDFDQGLIDAYSNLFAEINPDDFLDFEGIFAKEAGVDVSNMSGGYFGEEELEEGEIA